MCFFDAYDENSESDCLSTRRLSSSGSVLYGSDKHFMLDVVGTLGTGGAMIYNERCVPHDGTCLGCVCDVSGTVSVMCLGRCAPKQRAESIERCGAAPSAQGRACQPIERVNPSSVSTHYTRYGSAEELLPAGEAALLDTSLLAQLIPELHYRDTDGSFAPTPSRLKVPRATRGHVGTQSNGQLPPGSDTALHWRVACAGLRGRIVCELVCR